MSSEVRRVLERGGHSSPSIDSILSTVSELAKDFDAFAFKINPEADALRRFFYEISLFRSLVDLAVSGESSEKESLYRLRLIFQTPEDFLQMIRRQ